ncbi:MAG: hypothetical protein DCE90_07390 [Pseudanabaena sp.]|nr:MAG: hypothetical protein DCE90_07390 [Pseudanabaena sp.]
MFNSLTGFALEVGDRLFINEEEVIFKGWVDQSQTAIEVKVCHDESLAIKKIFAKEIRSLARSRQDVAESQEPPLTPERDRSPQSSEPPEASAQSNPKETKPEFTYYSDESLESKESDGSEDLLEEDINEVTPEPNYNAWEVWTYLERQRVKTLKLLNTFQAEWEANRFVREVERSTPPNLRIHYEVRPIVLSDAEIKAANQAPEYSAKSTQASDREQTDPPQTDYADAIDVEVVAESL